VLEREFILEEAGLTSEVTNKKAKKMVPDEAEKGAELSLTERYTVD